METKKQQKRKKAIEDEENVSSEKKAKEKDDFNAAKFKSMLKNVDTIFLALEEFSDAANGFPEYSDYDIVKDYIEASPDCSQIFHLIDGKTLKSAEVCKIFRVLESILIRTGDDLAEKYGAVGEGIVSHICGVNSKQVYLAANIRNKPNQLKSTIKLLTSMVLQGETSALGVLDLFNETNIGSLIPLFTHKNISDSQDVRTCVVHFIISFLLSGSNTLIRQLLKKTELIQNVFYNISQDKLELVEIILQIFQEKILENQGINKSTKVGIFNGRILNELTQLYYWCGPQKWRDSKSSKHGDIQDTATEEDKQTVIDLVHQFLSTLCCSFKHGIAFFDKTVGTGKRNHNITLSKMLTSLQHPYNHPKLKLLVIQVLKECPDLLQHYLPLFNHALLPRPTTEWLKCINFILEIYENQTTSPNLHHLEDITINNVVTIATTYFIPPEIIRKTLANGLKNESMVVRHKTLELYRFILNRGRTLIRSGESRTNRIPVDVGEYKKQMSETIIKMIPTINMMINCWNKTVHPKSYKNYPQSTALPNISATEHLILIEQFLCLNQQLVPDLIDRHPVILATLLDGVSKVTGGQDEQNFTDGIETVVENGQEDNNDDKMEVEEESQENKMANKADDNKMEVDWEKEDDDQKAILQLYLLKIISDSNSRLLPWKKKGKNKKSLMFQLLNILSGPASLAKTTRQLISKMLRGTGGFEGEDGELDIWLKHATPSNQHTSYLPVLAQILNRYISNYSNHQDKLAEILSIEKNNFPFTPLLMVAMEMIKKKEENSEEIKEFILRVLPSVYYIQVDTKMLQLLLASYKDQLKGVKSWKPPKKSNCDFHPVSMLMMSLPGDTKSVEDIEDEVTTGMVTMDTDELVLFSRQILLYLGESILQFSKNAEESKTKINFYFQLLHKILADVKTKMATVTFLESNAQTEVVKQTETFGDFCESENSEKKILKHILQNIYLQKSFLNCENENPKDEISVGQIISPPLLLIIENSASCLDTEDLEKLKYSYTDKILENLRTMGKSSAFETIVKCLQSLVPYLNEEYQSRFIDVVLEMSDSFIVSKRRREMTDAGKLVIQILSEKLKKHQTLLHQLSLEQTSKLFNCLKVTEDESLIHFCSELLEKNPAFSLACDKELWLHLLENDTDKMSEVMVKLYDNNYVCQTSFRNWIIEKADINKYKWCIKVRNSEELISLVYTTSNNLPRLSPTLDSTDIEIIKQLISTEKYGKKEMKIMWKNLSESLLETGVVNRPRLDLLQTLFYKLVTMDTRYREKLVILCFRILMMKTLEENVKVSILDLITDNIKLCDRELLTTDLEEIWPQFVKSSLRTMYLEPKLINILIDCIPLVYKKSHDQKLPIKFLYEMVMSHSKFLAVMFGEKSHEIKECIITLLLSIAEISTDCYDSNHIRIFLGVYGASLSISDQKLLKLIGFYDNNSTVDLNQYQPFLFGQKALDFYSSKKYQAPSILRETKMADLIDCLDESLLLKSALNFPLYRGLVPTEVKKADKLQGNEECYDPCFLLPVFSHLLHPGVKVDLKQFITSNCLGFVLAGLSSYVTSVRQTCYLILKQFYERLSMDTFSEVEEIRYLLDLLQHSIETPSMKLCSVITVFLSKMAKLLLSPENHMYKSLTTFLISKPTLEFDRIPGFYRFFNSSELDHHQERQWILNVMLEGLRTYDDFRIYETLYSFKLLQSYYQSLLSDLHSQTVILKIINSVCKEVETVTILYEKHGILTWLLGVILQLRSGSYHVSLITEIFHNIWFTIQSQLPTDSLVNIPIQFLYQIIQCLRHLLIKLGSENAASFHKITEILSSTLKYYKLVQQDKHLFLTKFDNLALKDIGIILLCLGKFNNNTLMLNQAQNLMSSINVDVTKLLPSATAAAAIKKWQPLNPKNDNTDKVGNNSENLKSEIEDKSNEVIDHNLDLQANYKKVKVNQTENVSEIIEIFLTWNPGKDVDNGTSSAAGFLLVATYLMDNCTKVKDKQLVLKILDWIGSVLFQNKSQNGGFVIFDNVKNFSKICGSVLTTNDDFIRRITDKLLFLYSYGNILLDDKQNTKIGLKFPLDSKSGRTSDLKPRDLTIGGEKDWKRENVKYELEELTNCGLIGKLNKILTSLMEISLEKSENKTKKIWKKNLKRIGKLDGQEKENLTVVLVQEYFLGVDRPEIFDNLYKLSSLKTDDVTMDTSINETK